MFIQIIKVSKPGTEWESLAEALAEFQPMTAGLEFPLAIGDSMDMGECTCEFKLKDGAIVTTRSWDDQAWKEFSEEFQEEVNLHRLALREEGWVVEADDGLSAE